MMNLLFRLVLKYSNSLKLETQNDFNIKAVEHHKWNTRSDLSSFFLEVGEL